MKKTKPFSFFQKMHSLPVGIVLALRSARPGKDPKDQSANKTAIVQEKAKKNRQKKQETHKRQKKLERKKGRERQKIQNGNKRHHLIHLAWKNIKGKKDGEHKIRKGQNQKEKIKDTEKNKSNNPSKK